MGKIELNTNDRFYWLKMQFDFFTQPSTMMIRASEHGSDIIVLFLMLVGAAANSNGYLRFSDSEPFTADSLSIVFGFPRAVVEAALVSLQRFHLIDILDDKTIVILNIEKYVGSESFWAEKKRQQRAKKGQQKDNEGQCPSNVREMSEHCPIDIDIDSDKEKEKECYARATVEQVSEFISENHLTNVNAKKFISYWNARNWMNKQGQDVSKNWRDLLIYWNETENDPNRIRGNAAIVTEQKTVRYLENDYSDEHLKDKERESFVILDDLLKE